MRTLIFVALMLCVPFVCNAAMSQAECPPDTIWNSSNNQCYPDPNAPSVKREQERQRQEAEKAREEQRRQQEADEAAKEAERRRRFGSETNTPNPSQPLYINK